MTNNKLLEIMSEICRRITILNAIHIQDNGKKSREQILLEEISTNLAEIYTIRRKEEKEYEKFGL